MKLIKERGNLQVFAGDGVARDLFIGKNKKTGKVSLWAIHKSDIKLSDCIY